MKAFGLVSVLMGLAFSHSAAIAEDKVAYEAINARVLSAHLVTTESDGVTATFTLYAIVESSNSCSVSDSFIVAGAYRGKSTVIDYTLLGLDHEVRTCPSVYDPVQTRIIVAQIPSDQVPVVYVNGVRARIVE